MHCVFKVYGGYVTSLLLSAEESPVKCGAVLSPITDFELYGKGCVCGRARACACACVLLMLTTSRK